jgi:uncharacterized protein YjiK
MVLLLAALTISTGCESGSSADAAEVSARTQRLATSLTNKDSTQSGPVARWILPKEIGEVSGLALTTDGRLLAHGDEVGRVYVIDPRGGAILKRFGIGNTDTDAMDDFEGITLAAEKIFMVASDGKLYEFAEGTDAERVSFLLHDTQLGKECEFEGIAFDSTRGVVVLPCKNVRTRDLRNHLVLYRWRLDGAADSTSAPLTIPLEQVIGSNGWKTLHPSDITVDPVTGNYVMVAAQEKALIEITASGAVVRAMPLPGKHGQAEGVALTPDGILIVGDEATNRPATLTLYRWPIPATTKRAP